MADATRIQEADRVETWAPPGDRQRWGEADGRAMAEAFRRSGLTTVEFAQRHGIGEWRVRRWTRRGSGKSPAGGSTLAGRNGSAVRFAPVRIAERPRGGTIEVAVGQAIVRVGPDFDEDLLRRVVSALGGGSGC